MRRTVFGFLLLPTIFAAVFAGAFQDIVHAAEWRPISPEERALKDDPMNPGASAIVLYYDLFVDDVHNFDRAYTRIKILKEDGRKYADVEIPFRNDWMSVTGIEARAIQPDGNVTEFSGEVFQKPYSKSRDKKLVAKTFMIPGVMVGSIIEYRYQLMRHKEYYFDSSWRVQGALSTRESHFMMIPLRELTISWVAFGLPYGAAVTPRPDGMIELNLRNIPAIPEEDFSPPEELIRAYVAFYYIPRSLSSEDMSNAENFWNPTGKDRFKADNAFIGKRKEIEALAQEVAPPSDPPEERLRKLYARAQKIRNLSFERTRSEKEQKVDKLKDNLSVGDVLKNGYGDGSDISRFFVALARAAGFEANVIYLAARNNGAFEHSLLSWRQMDASIVHVQLGDKQWFLDPASRYAPFKLLPWMETASRGIRPDKDGYTQITTPDPKSSEAVTQRKAMLKLEMDGSLEGTASYTLGGQDAYDWRTDNYEKDSTECRKEMEDTIKEMLPSGATIEITNSPNWQVADDKLVVEFKLKIPGYASATGTRMLMPPGVFQAREKYPFRELRRKLPILLDYPTQELDDVTISLPSGLQVESLPAARRKELPPLQFEIARTSEGQNVHLSRKVVINGFSFPATSYSVLRVFYDNVRAGDEEQIVLKAMGSPNP